MFPWLLQGTTNYVACLFYTLSWRCDYHVIPDSGLNHTATLATVDVAGKGTHDGGEKVHPTLSSGWSLGDARDWEQPGAKRICFDIRDSKVECCDRKTHMAKNFNAKRSQ